MAEKVIVYKDLVQTVHQLYCDQCYCEMNNIGSFCLTSYPPSYIYRYMCPHCQKVKETNELFPWTEIKGEKCDEYMIKRYEERDYAI